MSSLKEIMDMNEMELLHDNFNRFYSGFKSEEGFKTADFITSNLERFVSVVLEEWSGDLFFSHNENGLLSNDEQIIFTMRAMNADRVIKGNVSYIPVKTKVGITNKGRIVTFDSVTKATGNTTWNGDDEYFQEMGTTYTVKKSLYTSEIFDEFSKQKDITSDQIESLAVEFAQEITDLHNRSEFVV